MAGVVHKEAGVMEDMVGFLFLIDILKSFALGFSHNSMNNVGPCLAMEGKGLKNFLIDSLRRVWVDTLEIIF